MAPSPEAAASFVRKWYVAYPLFDVYAESMAYLLGCFPSVGWRKPAHTRSCCAALARVGLTRKDVNAALAEMGPIAAATLQLDPGNAKIPKKVM